MSETDDFGANRSPVKPWWSFAAASHAEPRMAGFDMDIRDEASREPGANDVVTLAIEVIESLSHVSSIVRDRVGDALLEANVNETRLTVMRSIAARGDSGCSQAELASALNQAESSVCTLIERMKKDGLVHRFRSKQDRRKSFLMLTPGGQEQLTAALEQYRAVAKGLHDCWGAERSTQLRDLLEDLRFALERPASEPQAIAASSAPAIRPAA